jgi:rhodanese-related sulfurtransferase
MENLSLLFLIGIALIAFLGIRSMLRMRSIKQYRPSGLSAHSGKDSSFILLDVRTDAERNEGCIPGSIHIPLQVIRGRTGELERYRNREIICYCRSGSRSMSAALLLKKEGYRVANLRGGISEWNFHRL